MTTWTEVQPEHEENCTNYQGSGGPFVEGSNNLNPWSEEIGAGDAAYCISAACIVPYHHGVRWPQDSQFGELGWAYCPYARTGFTNLGIWSEGRGVDLQPGDIVLYDWNGDGVADHAETVKAVYDDETFDTYGYNCGTPEGAHIVRRNTRYLMGRARLDGTIYQTDQPTPGVDEDNMNDGEKQQLFATLADINTKLDAQQAQITALTNSKISEIQRNVRRGGMAQGAKGIEGKVPEYPDYKP